MIHRKILRVIFILCLIVICKIETLNVPITSEYYTSITSPNFPNPYPITKQEWLIGTDNSGIGVEVIIKTLDLDGSASDYLLLQPGGKDEKTESYKIFTWNLKTERKYRLFHLDQLYMYFESNEKTENTHKGFEVLVKRISDIPEPTEPPTTENPYIMRPLATSYIYLYGMNHSDFMEKKEEFRLSLADIAEQYCEAENITVDVNVTISDNVNFHVISQCQINWPNSELCVSIKYSIPVNSFNLTDGYELSNKSLDDMWSKYSSKINWTIPELQPLSKYDPPNDYSIIMAWVWISIGVLIIFLILLYLIWRYGYLLNDYVSALLIHEDVEHRKSDASFFPIPHQVVPSLFGFDSYVSEDKTWSNFPPDYSEDAQDNEGQINRGYENDNDLFDCDDEIVMTLEDLTDSRDQPLRRSIDTLEEAEGLESNL